MMNRSYHEAMQIPQFEERFKYLALKGRVGESTFGSKRYLNQMLYQLPDWKSIKQKVIIRDNGCDLAHPDFEIISDKIYVHHINPITIDDILNGSSKVLDLDNLISTSFQTHQAIHYGDESLLPKLPVERSPYDTRPWR